MEFGAGPPAGQGGGGVSPSAAGVRGEARPRETVL